MMGLRSFPNKIPGKINLFIDNNRSLLYVFVTNINEHDCIMKGTYGMHDMAYIVLHSSETYALLQNHLPYQ